MVWFFFSKENDQMPHFQIMKKLRMPVVRKHLNYCKLTNRDTSTFPSVSTVV